MKPIFIDALSLEDAWYQTLYACLEHGGRFKIDRGSYAGSERLELDYTTIHIKRPWEEPLLPRLPETATFPPPGDQDYLNKYVSYFMTGELSPGESYTYGSRICATHIDQITIRSWDEEQNKNIFIQDEEVWYNKDIIFSKEVWNRCLNQINLLIWTYKNKGFRNNQMVLQIARPEDMLLQDPPCCREIDTRIQEKDGKFYLHFFPEFRSWDLFNGFPVNLAAIELMKQYIALELGVENGQIIARSKGIHLYSHVWEIAQMLRGKTYDKLKGELK